MLTPVPAVLPDSTLAPADILAKFSPQTLAGLGRVSGLGVCGDCLGWDDTGEICVGGYDTSGCGDTSGGSSSGPLFPITTPIVTTTPIVMPSSSGGTVVSAPPAGGTNWAQVAAALAQGGINIAELQNIQPGTQLTAAGITRQSPGATTQGTPLVTSTAVSAGGSTLMLLAIAGFAIFAFSESRKP